MSKCISCKYALYDGMCLALGKFTTLDANACSLYKPNANSRFASLKAENAKLRELAKAAWGCVKRQVSCDDCRMVFCGCTLATAMRECGIEVTENE